MSFASLYPDGSFWRFGNSAFTVEVDTWEDVALAHCHHCGEDIPPSRMQEHADTECADMAAARENDLTGAACAAVGSSL